MASEIKNAFVSHVHEDDELLPELKELLARSGFEIRDSSISSDKPNDAQSPEYIKSEILAPRIKWASTMIVLISPETHTSPWVEWEIEYAAKEGKRIVGVYVRGGKDADVPKGLDTYADAVVGWNADAVIDAIDGKSSEWHQADGAVRLPRDLPRYKC